jgi:hypothetical protein
MRKRGSVTRLAAILVVPMALLATSSEELVRHFVHRLGDIPSREPTTKVLLTDSDANLLKNDRSVNNNELVVLASAPVPQTNTVPQANPVPRGSADQIITEKDTPNDSFRALLRSNGGVLVNGSPVPSTTTLFGGDIVQTQTGFEAKILGNGFTITMESDTLISFGVEPRLEHGTVSVQTTTGLRVRVGCLAVIPLTIEQTSYEVTDADGSVKAAARTNDVRLESRSTKIHGIRQKDNSLSNIIHEGQHATRQDKCGGADTRAAATAGTLDSLWAKTIGGTAIGGVLTWVLLSAGSPVSPSVP